MLAAVYRFHGSYNWRKLLLLFVAAFIVRAIPFYSYIQHKERYRQADAMDYHVCALGLYYGVGLRRLDNKWPTFWRTPGYPLYLAAFYKLYGVQKPQFNENILAQKAALWVQILLSSFTPILIFFLVLSLLPLISLAWIIAWIFVFHLGFVLTSGYVSTEALSMLLFFCYLIFFYKRYRFIGEGSGYTIPPWWHIALCALFLGAYTWIRPMGQFVAVVTLVLLACAAVPWKRKLANVALFAAIFFGSLSPWIIRNYHFTGKIFFWPGSGPNLVCFSVPKILRRLTGQSFGECHSRMMKQVNVGIIEDYTRLQREEPHYYVSQELVCAKLAWPWILQYPLYFIQDWLREICKTTFDLYASQLVDFARNTYTFDPMEDFLSEKLADCIYKQPMHWFMRLLCSLEALFAIVKWIGIFSGFVLFFLRPLWFGLREASKKHMFFVWLKAGIMIAVVLSMTGAFGYARLRMPVEPLLILLSLTFWYKLLYKPDE